MVFEETELDTSVSAVLAKAKLDIAEQNQDIATVAEQKRQMREYTKKRLLANFEQEASQKAVAEASLKQDFERPPVPVPVLEKDSQLKLDFDPALPKDEIDVPSPSPKGLESEPLEVAMPAVSLADELESPNVIPVFSTDEFLAQEPGPELKDLTNGLVEAPTLPVVQANVEQDPAVAPELATRLDDQSQDVSDIQLRLSQSAGDSLASGSPLKVEVFPALDADKALSPEVVPVLPEDEALPTAPKVAIKNETMDGFFPIPVMNQDKPLSVQAKPILPEDDSEVANPRPEVENEDSKVAAPSPKVDADGNYTFIEDLTTKDLDHFFIDSPKVQVSNAGAIQEALKPSAFASSPKPVDLNNMGPNALPFTGLPPGFASSVRDSGSDSNFGDKLAAGAKDIIFNTLTETVTDFIDQALQEYDENFLSFDITKVLENFLENVQNKDISNTIPIPDREFRLSSAQAKSLVDNTKNELRSAYEGAAEPTTVVLSWQNYAGMLDTIADQLYKVTSLGVSATDTVGISYKVWNTIVGSMLTNAEYPGKKTTRGVNPAIDALVESGPDFYKNQYDLILVQVDGNGELLDSQSPGPHTEEEAMANLLGSSMLAVRSAGLQIPEMKSKTVDIPILWTSVTKAVPHTEMSRRQTLSIDADQYLFLYDTFLKLSGKFYASSKYGLIDPARAATVNGYTPIQLGSMVAAAWSDSAWGKKLSDKARLDLIVKLRNFSPVLSSDWNIAPGLEPYFVFEDVRFLGNGALSLGRSEVTKATFEAEFIYRRVYKVNLNSHPSGGKGTPATTTDYITGADYSMPSDGAKLVMNDPAMENLASSASPLQLNAPETSQARFGTMSGHSSSKVREGVAGAEQAGTDANDRAKAALTGSLEKAKDSPAKIADVDKVITTMLSAYSQTLATVTGDMTPKYSAAPEGMGNTVGPVEPQFHFKWKKPDLAPIASVIQEAVMSALGAQAQGSASAKAVATDAVTNQMIEKAQRELAGSLNSAKAYSGAQVTVKRISSSIQQEMADTVVRNDSAQRAMMEK